MRQPSNEIISHMPGYMDLYQYKRKAKVTSQVEDMKQHAKMAQKKMVIRRILQYAHNVNTLQKQST